MSAESIVKKWASCHHSLAFGYGGEDGHELRSQGFNENYACEHPEVVTSGQHKITGLYEDGKTTQVAVLHGTGHVEDPTVIKTLEASCMNCPYYLKNRSPWEK